MIENLFKLLGVAKLPASKKLWIAIVALVLLAGYPIAKLFTEDHTSAATATVIGNQNTVITGSQITNK